mmetsp:Transcript_104885/g.306334  ORF Transcript_104885/g.306334 Transcript_104885/m.306334 type:complete len:103 (+) Transcript_104885:366-674(+)
MVLFAPSRMDRLALSRSAAHENGHQSLLRSAMTTSTTPCGQGCNSCLNAWRVVAGKRGQGWRHRPRSGESMQKWGLASTELLCGGCCLAPTAGNAGICSSAS